MGSAPNFVRNRQWKESVANATDWRGYVLITDMTLRHLNQTAEGFQGQEFWSDEVKLYGLNLEERYASMVKACRAVVSPEEADGMFSLELSVATPIVWEWLNDPSKRNQWYPSLLKWNAYSRPGTVNHCDHVVGMVVETIRLEPIPNERTRVLVYLRFQTLRWLAKPIGLFAARFLESRIRRINGLVSNERLNKDE